jgi:hypothetical protein
VSAAFIGTVSAVVLAMAVLLGAGLGVWSGAGAVLAGDGLTAPLDGDAVLTGLPVLVPPLGALLPCPPASPREPDSRRSSSGECG